MDGESSMRNTLATLVIVVVVVLGGVVLLLATRPEPVRITVYPPEPTDTPAPTPTHEPITVYITGMVAEPESMVSLPYGSRVEDAIMAAGGLLDEADTQRVNLAGILHDGDQVHVPAANNTQTPVVDLDDIPTPSGGDVVYINTATLAELETLPGIGPTLGQRILDYRDEHGAFTSLEELANVDGIGSSTLENLAGLIVFE